MPIVNGKYKNPGWENNTAPAIDETELNALSDTVEDLDSQSGDSPEFTGNVQIEGVVDVPSITFLRRDGTEKVELSADTEAGEVRLTYNDGNTGNNPVLVHGVKTPEADTDAANKAYVDSAVNESADTKMDKVNPTGSGIMTLGMNDDQPGTIAMEGSDGTYAISPNTEDSLLLGYVATGSTRPIPQSVDLYGITNNPKYSSSATNKAYVDGIKTSVKTILQAIYDLLATNAWDTAEAATGVQALQQLINQL